MAERDRIAAASRTPSAAPAQSAGLLRGVARDGLRGARDPYPFAPRIRESFGRFAPPRIVASIGTAARTAARSLNAQGFALGHRVGFDAPPSLHTAAHEAAHVAAAGLGARVAGGVGHPGDAHERLADAAAGAVVAGRSAEPVFHTAFGDRQPAPAPEDGAALQMKNRIIAPDPPPTTTHKTPWKQIDDTLKAAYQPGFDLRTHIKNYSSGFRQMVEELGDSALRATQVTAKLDTSAKAPRRSVPMQTAYGNLGDFMAQITGTPLDEAYEGGHLVSDEILGTASNVGYNLAPQIGSLNRADYRKIETLAQLGTESDTGTATYTVKVSYEPDVPNPTFDFDLGTIVDRLNIRGYLDPSKLPDGTLEGKITLNAWVPSLWRAKVVADEKDDVMSGTSRIDLTDPGRGTARGYFGLPSAVKKKARPSDGEAPETIRFMDTLNWGMDSMLYNVPPGSKLWHTGQQGDRRSQHKWAAVQPVPRGQNARNKGGPVALPKPAMESFPKLGRTFSLTAGLAGDEFAGDVDGPDARSQWIIDRLDHETHFGFGYKEHTRKASQAIFSAFDGEKKSLKRARVEKNVNNLWGGKGSAAKRRKTMFVVNTLLSNTTDTSAKRIKE